MGWYISWLFVMETVAIVAGNIITIVVFGTTQRLRKRQYVLIVCLAISDLMVGLVSVPMHIAFEEYPGIKSSYYFKLVYFVQDLSFGTASLAFLALLAVERAHATYFPFKHNSLGTSSYVAAITFVSVFSLLSGALAFLIPINLVVYLYIKLTKIFIILVVICLSYLLIFIKVRLTGMESNTTMAQENKKLNVTLAVVTIISLVAWVPYKATIAYVALNESVKTTSGYWLARSITKVSSYANSMANFIVYAFRMREFRSEIVRRLGCHVRVNIVPNIRVEMKQFREM